MTVTVTQNFAVGLLVRYASDRSLEPLPKQQFNEISNPESDITLDPVATVRARQWRGNRNHGSSTRCVTSFGLPNSRTFGLF